MGKNIDLWSDCERIPLRFAVHVAQHNERVLARVFGCPRELLTELKYHQRRVKFAGSVELAKPESWVWSHSAGFRRFSGVLPPPESWVSALNLPPDSVLIGEPDEGIRLLSLR